MTPEGAVVVAVICLASYLLGAIPFGFLAARMRGIDITKQGSGNTGATNVLRTLGAAYAVPVLILDMGKGAAAAYLGLKFLGLGSMGAVAAGACAIAGHNWSIFLGLRGGKGVATSAGVAFVAFPYLALAAVAVFILVVVATRYVSLGSILGALAAFLLSLTPPYGLAQRVTIFILVAAITFQHRSNIARLLSGNERKIGEKATIRKGGEPR